MKHTLLVGAALVGLDFALAAVLMALHLIPRVILVGASCN